MKQIHPILLQVCYNFVADYIILFFIKRDLFPEKKQSQIIKAAAIFSMTYVIWEWTTTGMSPVTRGILKWCSILALICRFFKITSVSLFRKTITVFLCYLFLMGGSVTFFLTCIQIDQVKAIKEAYKAIAVLFLSSGILLAYKRKQKQEKREEEARKNIYDIRISRKGKTITCRGFYDSGNLLTSRITGQGVCIITQEKAREILMPKEQQEVKKILTDSSESLSWRMWAKQFQEGMYILQYSSVGKKNAKMPGVMAEQIVVLKNEEVLVKTKGMLGISSEKFVEQNTFSILLPADIFEREKNRNII